MRRFSIATLQSLEVRRFLSASDLDMSFDTDGKLVTGTLDTEVGTDMLIQPDGKIVVVGTAGSGTTRGVVLRFLPDGTPDPTFGGGDGRVDELLSGNVEFDAVALDGSGNIYVAGTSFAGGVVDMFLARFKPDGTLDDGAGGFAGGAGFVTSGLLGSDFGRDIALSGGGIIVGGYRDGGVTDNDFAALKFTTSGALDPFFGSGGVASFDILSGSADTAESMVVQPDGKIVLAGASDNEFALMRLTSSGALDDGVGGFAGGTGHVRTSAGVSVTFASFFGVTLGSGGSIIAAGTFVDTANHFAVAKYDSAGDIDTVFGTGGTDGIDGIVEVGGGALVATDVTIDSGGKVIAVGSAVPLADVEVAVVRLDQTSGAPDDPGFAADGLVTTPVGGFAAASSVAIDSSGRIVVAGVSDDDFLVARYGGAPAGGVTVQLIGADLEITGTSGAESIVITRNTDGINVEVNGSPAGSGFNPSGMVVVKLGDGNDQVNVASSVTTPLFIDAGAGDDTVKGGNGNDILIGGPGLDRLMGAGGRDLMIGGTGTDRMLGDNEDDILIAASTTYDSNETALFAIHTEWTSSHSYLDRVNNIRNGSGVEAELNGTFFLDSVTVVDDGEVDSLSGNAGTDWFVFNEGHDVITDVHRNEFGEDLV